MLILDPFKETLNANFLDNVAVLEHDRWYFQPKDRGLKTALKPDLRDKLHEVQIIHNV